MRCHLALLLLSRIATRDADVQEVTTLFSGDDVFKMLFVKGLKPTMNKGIHGARRAHIEVTKPFGLKSLTYIIDQFGIMQQETGHPSHSLRKQSPCFNLR